MKKKTTTNKKRTVVKEASSMRKKKGVPSENLSRVMDPASFQSETTGGLEPLEGTIGQERGVRSINFALAHGTGGFNCYVSGPIGTGKMTTVTSIVRKRAKDEKNSLDWIL